MYDKKIDTLFLSERKSLSTVPDVLDLVPNLISLQKQSYENFFSYDDPSGRSHSGLNELFKNRFNIVNIVKDNFSSNSSDGNSSSVYAVVLNYLSYRFGEPKYSYKDCLHCPNRTYSVSLFVTLRLIVFDDVDENLSTPTKVEGKIRSFKDQEVFLCNVPLMTEKGSFVINGIERVVVSQIRKSAGVFFDSEISKISNSVMYSAKIIPFLGNWLVFFFDTKNNMYVRLDNKGKIPISTFLLAFGLTKEEILSTFYDEFTFNIKDDSYFVEIPSSEIVDKKFNFDLLDPKTKKVIFNKNEKISKRRFSQLKNIDKLEYCVSDEDLSNYVLSKDVINPETGEVLFSFCTALTPDLINVIKNYKISSISVIKPISSDIGDFLYQTLSNNLDATVDSAYYDIYTAIRKNNDILSKSKLKMFFDNVFFSSRYDLSKTGRIRMNQRLNINVDEDCSFLTKEDIIATIRVLSKMKRNASSPDDIDSLSSRRLFTLVDLLNERLLSEFAKFSKLFYDKTSNTDLDSIVPSNLINSSSFSSTIRSFFTVSQFSQLMDQTNSLSEIAHKRRITSFGLGGIKKERAGFDVRDIHYTQYGRICPVETPEGQNIGLVINLALFAQLDKYGFITTPYKRVINGVVQNDIVYLSSYFETDHFICSAQTKLDENNKIIDEKVLCRHGSNFLMVDAETVEYIELSTRQVASVSTNLIPFVENDDAKRALLASNMMRQAVPFAVPEKPFVGTGLEKIVAVDSVSTICSDVDGVVRDVDSSKIIIEYQSDNYLSNFKVFYLDKYLKTNNDTCINQRPIVNIGDKVSKGQMLTNSLCVDDGDLSIGKNALVAFLPWDGFNHEDSVLVSDRLVSNDQFNSIHIQVFEVSAKDTIIGSEEITRDIPNVSQDVLKKLDESGIIHVGAEVVAGDILVGKVTPRSDVVLTPEEKLLLDISGDIVLNVKDTSLYLPLGVLEGVVVDVQVFNRQGIEKDERSIFLEKQKIENLFNVRQDVENLLRKDLRNKIIDLFENEFLKEDLGEFTKDDKLSKDVLMCLSDSSLMKIVVYNKTKMNSLGLYLKEYNSKLLEIKTQFEKDVKNIKEDSDLPVDVLKTVRVYVATKQKLQPGDKVCGRHGNKGVVSKIVPVSDMPYLSDGTPIDILLTPSGVPSRMNIGQVLESNLGLISVRLGQKISSILDNANIKDDEREKELRSLLLIIFNTSDELKKIKDMSFDELISFSNSLRKGVYFSTGSFSNVSREYVETLMNVVGLDKSGKVTLYDGRTGEPFERTVTVGYMYMLKLYHLVDTKIHARSIGPYNLVTQQPLQGKAHFGGQRLGEMECWALEGYGAAYTLQEMLTIKSDDIVGRNKIFESIVNGSVNFYHGIPESFNVLISEIRGLGLNIEMIKDN